MGSQISGIQSFWGATKLDEIRHKWKKLSLAIGGGDWGLVLWSGIKVKGQPLRLPSLDLPHIMESVTDFNIWRINV